MEFARDLFGNLALGLDLAASATNLTYCFIGVFVGTFVGVLPGLGALTAISLLLPITFHLDATASIVMLAGVFYGANYGGSTASILLNLPGEPSSAVTCLDGYPMSRQGRSGVALLMTTVASFVGANIGILVMVFFSPVILEVALEFGAEEYFSMMLLGLVAASTVSTDSPVKGVAMVTLGVLLGVVGVDVQTSTVRFTFGMVELYDGLSLVAIATGLFGVSEVIASVRTVGRGHVDRKSITFRSMLPTREDLHRSWAPMLRGSAVGSFFGALPGTGAAIASFMAYAVEKKAASDPARFGKGAIEGIAAPEASNNAAVQTAFIPTLTLGIPGTVTMALMIGALIIHGITPGPLLMTNRPDLFWGLIVSFWIGNLFLLIINIPMIGLWIRLLSIPYHLLYPAILMFVCIGVYSVNYNFFDIVVVMVFGAAGYVMRLLEFPPAPLLLGFVLGPLMEENLNRAVLISRGDFWVFVERPISAAFLAATILLLVWMPWRAWRGQRRARLQSGQTGSA